MPHDFDALTDRTGTHSLKWDLATNTPDAEPVIPLWVADMDFPPPPAVVAAVRARADHPIYGYTNHRKDYLDAVVAWTTAAGRTVDRSEILVAPGVMASLSMALKAFTAEGDRILINPPTYYSLFKVVRSNRRALVEAPLAVDGQNRWTLDWVRMEAELERCRQEGRPVKAYLLCSPHNPVGRVWTLEEFGHLSRLAAQYGFLIFSDEIHSDLVFPPHRHVSLVDVDDNLASRTLVFTGPNKTFNIAGLLHSHVIVRQEVLRSTMKAAIEAECFDQPNTFSQAAAFAAYTEGRPWLDDLLVYLWGNYQELLAFLRDRFPETTVAPLEGTYLAWVDVRETLRRRGFTGVKDLAAHLEKVGRVKFTPGTVYQTGGEGYLRINLASPRSLLRQGLDRMARTLESPRLRG